VVERGVRPRDGLRRREVELFAVIDVEGRCFVVELWVSSAHAQYIHTAELHYNYPYKRAEREA
jgi:hypothetical protein